MKPGKTRRRFWGRISLADKLLLAFMLVLLVQSGHNLFVNELGQGTSTELDVVIRTTSAAVFGYFISAGVPERGESTTTASRTKIGFAVPEEEALSARMEEAEASGLSEELTVPSLDETTGTGQSNSGAKTVIVGLIGLASLGLLILARNCGQSSPEAMAALSQLRDFVSGSVGFLIAHGGRTSRT